MDNLRLDVVCSPLLLVASGYQTSGYQNTVTRGSEVGAPQQREGCVAFHNLTFTGQKYNKIVICEWHVTKVTLS